MGSVLLHAFPRMAEAGERNRHVPRRGRDRERRIWVAIVLALPIGVFGVPGRAVTVPPPEAQPTSATAVSLRMTEGEPPAHSTCDDGDPCTRLDLCVRGACIGGRPVSCPPIDECHLTGVCAPETGGCATPAVPDGTPCEDGLFCTTRDTCRAGGCVGGEPRDCNDRARCTTDLCDEEMRGCNHSMLSPCCGNGIRESGESCDAGGANADTPNASCRTDCRSSRCGDGILDDAFGERCDDGRGPPGASAPPSPPAAAGDGCRSPCEPPRCGDGVTDGALHEQCDDGNLAPGDGCSPRCLLEPPPAAATIESGTDAYTECVVAWRVAGVDATASDLPLRRAPPCRDGDGACDHDGRINGECRFHVWLCSNTTRPANIPCNPGTGRNGVGTVVLAEVRAPTARQAAREPADADNRAALELAAAAAAVGGNRDVCGPRLDIRVPLKPRGRKATTRLRLRATTNRNLRDGETLRLVCVPARDAGRRLARGSATGATPHDVARHRNGAGSP